MSNNSTNILNVVIVRVNPDKNADMSLERYKKYWTCKPERVVKQDYFVIVETGVNKVIDVYKINHNASTLYTTICGLTNKGKQQTKCTFECLEQDNTLVSLSMKDLKIKAGRSPLIYDRFDLSTAKFEKYQG